MARFCDDSELEQVKTYVTNKEEYHQEGEAGFRIGRKRQRIPTAERHVHVQKKVCSKLVSSRKIKYFKEKWKPPKKKIQRTQTRFVRKTDWSDEDDEDEDEEFKEEAEDDDHSRETEEDEETEDPGESEEIDENKEDLEEPAKPAEENEEEEIEKNEEVTIQLEQEDIPEFPVLLRPLKPVYDI